MEDWTKIATTDLHDIDCFIKFDHAQKIHIQWDPDMGSSKKSCSKGILESCGLPGANRIFAMEH